jgi:hypothetical protein
MSSIPVKCVCPLGAQCEEVKDGAIHRCMWHIKVRGANPNTGEELDEWRCAMAWLPLMLIENSQQQRQTGAAVESFRNEMVKANEMSHKVLLTTLQECNPDMKVIAGK